MPMPMMNVRKVRMLMHDSFVPMPVLVRLIGPPFERMFVSMMLVVNVSMAVLDRFMNMFMLMSLDHVQPDPTSH